MRTMQRVALAVTLAAVVAEPAAGQVPAARRADRADLRQQIYLMEGMLARAVSAGVQRLNNELRTVAPGLLVLAGEANARGFYLEGYGVFFDVEVPALRESVVWSLRTMLEQDLEAAHEALLQVRQFVQSQSPRDPGQRAALDNALRRIELQMRALLPGPPSVVPAAPTAPPPGSAGRGQVSAAGILTEAGEPEAASARAPAAEAERPSIDRVWLEDPGRAYTESVQRALIDAMIDWSAPMKIANDEWFVVAARDNERRDRLAPPDPYEEVLTLILKIRGSDLAAYRAGRIDAEEVRRRVLVESF